MKKLIKNFITSSPFLYRKYINLKNYFSTKNKLKNSTGQIKDDQLKNQLIDLISKNEVNNIVEIGTWNGLGSTTMLLNIIKDSNKNINFYSIESDLLCFKAAKKNLKNNLEKVNLILGRVHELDDLHYVNKSVIYDFGYGDKEYEWFFQDLRRYKKIMIPLPKNREVTFLAEKKKELACRGLSEVLVPIFPSNPPFRLPSKSMEFT